MENDPKSGDTPPDTQERQADALAETTEEEPSQQADGHREKAVNHGPQDDGEELVGSQR